MKLYMYFKYTWCNTNAIPLLKQLPNFKESLLAKVNTVCKRQWSHDIINTSANLSISNFLTITPLHELHNIIKTSLRLLFWRTSRIHMQSCKMNLQTKTHRKYEHIHWQEKISTPICKEIFFCNSKDIIGVYNGRCYSE